MEQTHVTLKTQTFDQALMQLGKQAKITYDTALAYANSPDDLALKISGVSGSSDEDYEKPATAPKPVAKQPDIDDGIERFGD